MRRWAEFDFCLAAILAGLLLLTPNPAHPQEADTGDAHKPAIVLPLERTTYFIGEAAPLAFAGVQAEKTVRIEALHAYGRLLLYEGEPQPVLLQTGKLAPGEYALEINRQATGTTLTLVSTIRKSASSFQDEWLPSEQPRLSREESRDPAIAERKLKEHRDQILLTLKEAGLSACFAMSACEMGHRPLLDTLAKAGPCCS